MDAVFRDAGSARARLIGDVLALHDDSGRVLAVDLATGDQVAEVTAAAGGDGRQPPSRTCGIAAEPPTRAIEGSGAPTPRRAGEGSADLPLCS